MAPQLPVVGPEGKVIVEPVAIQARRMVKRRSLLINYYTIYPEKGELFG